MSSKINSKLNKLNKRNKTEAGVLAGLPVFAHAKQPMKKILW
jgi:hypothetical protein